MWVNKPELHRHGQETAPPDLRLGVTWRAALVPSEEVSQSSAEARAGKARLRLSPAQRLRPGPAHCLFLAMPPP